ncbi:MAG: LysM peptidoglycan-binding domain-containing protein [Planctomycetes bacterium]|nr:LysM peptidoglycan-binding domain-containing protein [Planctomycetota bacterium]
MRTDFKIGLAIGLFIIVGMGLYFVFTSGGTKGDKGVEQAAADAGKDRHGERPKAKIQGEPQVARADQPKPADRTKPANTTGGTTNGNNKPAGGSPTTDDPWKLPIGGNQPKPSDPLTSSDPGKTSSLLPKTGDSGTPSPTGTTGKTPSEPAAGDFVIKPESTEKKPDITKTDPGTTGKVDVARDPGKAEPAKTGPTSVEPGKSPGGTGVSKAPSPGNEYNVTTPAPRTTTPTPAPAKGPQLDLGGIGKSPAPAATATQQDTTYIVQAGDNGFWAISQKVYGDGKHFNLIAQANPKVDPLRLQKGQRITVPPLPAAGTSSSVAGTSGSQHGSVVTEADGKKYYVVKSGDQGFWGIAEKQYGNGKYMTLIEKANPEANPHSLKIGQKLLLPPKPAEAVAAGGTTAGTGTTPVPAGSTSYVVKEDDTRGLWGIAEKQYGNGQLWTLIQQANNNIEASKLKPGMTLVIPPASSAERTAAGGSTGTAEPARRTPSAAPPSDVIRDPDTPVF